MICKGTGSWIHPRREIRFPGEVEYDPLLWLERCSLLVYKVRKEDADVGRRRVLYAKE